MPHFYFSTKTVLQRAFLAAALPLVIFAAPTAHASSPDAWAKLKEDVSAKCTEAAGEFFRKPKIVVDPTGSESLGLAILFGKSASSGERASIICVYDKKTGKVELGSEMGMDVVRVRGPKKEADDGED